jgi:hypothetical protein
MFLLTFSIAVTDEHTRLARVETALFCHGAARGAAGGRHRETIHPCCTLFYGGSGIKSLSFLVF